MIVPRQRDAVPPRPIALEKVLLVEGDTPAHFFEALAKHLGRESSIEIRSFGGISQLSRYLRVLATTAEFRSLVKSLGIIRDAENDPSAARAAVQAAIHNAQLPPALVPNIFILPDNVSPGMIETLCVRSIQTTPAYPCVDQFLSCVRNAGVSIPDDSQPILDKTRLQVYLATCKDTQMMPGIAASRGAYPFDNDAFSAIRQFITSL